MALSPSHVGFTLNAKPVTAHRRDRMTRYPDDSLTDHRRRHTNNEVRCEGAVQFGVVLDDFDLPSWQPVTDSWCQQADLVDVVKVLDALDVASVVPAEEAGLLV